MTVKCKLLPLLLVSCGAAASLDGTIYLGQGLAYGDGGNMVAEDGEWEPGLHEVAINANWRITPRWRIAAQGTWRQLGILSDEDPAIDYLFVQYRHPLPRGQLAATAGRYKNPQGWYNASRDSAFSRPSILLPSSVYREWSRDAQLRRDGVQFEGQHYWGEQSFAWSAGFGGIEFSDEFNRNVVGTSDGIDTDSDGSFGATLEWHYRPWLQFKYSYADTQLSITNANASLSPQQFQSIDSDIYSHLIGWRSEWGQWQWTAEYIYQRLDSDVVSFGVSNTLKSDGGYLQGRYLLNNQWQLFGRYDVYYPNRDDRDGDLVAPPRPNYAAYSKTWSMGASWQFSPNWQLAGEWHRIKGGASLPNWQLLLPGQTETNDLFLLQLAYRWNWTK